METILKQKALITGINGNLGSHMADLLLEKGFEVYGTLRYSTTGRKTHNIDHILNEIELVEGDINDTTFLNNTFKTIKPHIIYNFSAQSHVRKSWDIPLHTAETTGISVLKMLEAIKNSGFNSKFIQASTSELFGNSEKEFQNENTPFSPASPYAIAKLFAHWTTINYRTSYNMWSCCSICFNSESPRRGENFVTKKIVKGATNIKNGTQNHLELGNLEGKRDWNHSKDTVYGIWLQSQHNEPDEFVFGSGETWSVKEFLVKVFSKLELNWEDYVKINPIFFRPTEVNVLKADATKARKILNWKPKYNLDKIVEDMINNEYKSISSF